MAFVASQFQDLTVPDMRPSTFGSMADTMNSYGSLVEPRQLKAQQNYKNQILQLRNLRAITPEAASQIAGGANLQAASTGGGSYQDIMGMTPEEYSTLVAPKEMPSQIFARNLKIADTVNGNTELRHTLEAGAKAGYDNSIAMVNNAAAFAGGQDTLRRTQEDQHLKDFNTDTLAVDKYDKDFDYRMKNDNRLDDRARSQLAQTYKMHKENYDQREREYKYVRDTAIEAARQAGTRPVMPADEKFTDAMVSLANINSPGYMVKDSKTGKVNFDLQKLADASAKTPQKDGRFLPTPQVRNAVEANVLINTQNKPLGFNMDVSAFANALDGYDTLGMDVDGLHGAIKDPRTGTIIGYTDEPIVWYPGAKPSKSGKGSSTTSARPKYAPAK